MRTTQFFGLSAQAKQWLTKHCKSEQVKTCPCCGSKSGGKLISYDLQESSAVEGMFGEKVHILQQYELKNGKGYVEEFIQAELWSSGPCIFLALRFSSTKEIVKQSLWGVESIINNC